MSDILASRIEHALNGEWDQASIQPHELQVLFASTLGSLSADNQEATEGDWKVVYLEFINGGVDVSKLGKGWSNENGRWKYEVSPKDQGNERVKALQRAMILLGYFDHRVRKAINPHVWEYFTTDFNHAVHDLSHNILEQIIDLLD